MRRTMVRVASGNRCSMLSGSKINAFGEILGKEALDLIPANTIAGLLDAQPETLLAPHHSDSSED